MKPLSPRHLMVGLLSLIPAGLGHAQSEVGGEQKVWHKTTLTFDGPNASETATDNPFLNYRLEVDFTSPDGTRTFTTPGYFAGDGGGGAAGSAWRANFMPDAPGQWDYNVRFETGANVAVADSFGTGSTTGFHGTTGSFNVAGSDKSGRDFRAADHGLIKNRGHHYLTYGGSGDVWIKGGPNIPENFLGYDAFDNTPNAGHSFPSHAADWNAGDPTWNGGQGKEIIGAINYISSTGANSIYFLPMNLGGDGKDTFPFIQDNQANNTRYDLSKLQQWEQVFTHAQSKGVFLHFQLAETESANENFFDNGDLGNERKLFYRELVARFGHHPGLQWNLGEENDFGSDKREAFAAFIKSVDPYDHPLTTHMNTNQFEDFYANHLSDENFDMTSFQATEGGMDFGQSEDAVEEWRRRSAEAGAPWVVSFDEPQRIDNELSGDHDFVEARKKFMWPTYLSGGGGFEWYVRTESGSHSFDQNIEDMRELDSPLQWTGHALKFLEQLPLLEMEPDDDLVRGEDGDFGGAQVLAKAGEIYAIYLPDGSNDDNTNTAGEIQAGVNGPPELDLRGLDDIEFLLRWYDPRTGEFAPDEFILNGGDWVSLGLTPDGFHDTSDWAAIVVVPEPAAGILFSLGGPLLFLRHRRR